MRISFDFNLALFQGTHYQEYACQKELNSGLLIVVVVFSILIFMTPPPPSSIPWSTHTFQLYLATIMLEEIDRDRLSILLWGNLCTNSFLF